MRRHSQPDSPRGAPDVDPDPFDDAWLPGLDGQSSTRQVYRDHESIGRVRRWQKEDPGVPTREWFTAEPKKGAFHEPSAGEHATFEEALERVIFYGVEP